jgi:hypothetical protein
VSDRADVIEQKHRAALCSRTREVNAPAERVLANLVSDHDRLSDAPILVALLERRMLRIASDRVEADGLARFERLRRRSESRRNPPADKRRSRE